MNARTLALAPLVGFVISCVIAAQGSRPQSAASRESSWLPLEVGAYWEYETRAHEKVSLGCTRCSLMDGELWFTVERRGPEGATEELWRVRQDGIYMRSRFRTKLGFNIGQPIRVLELPAGISGAWRETREPAPSGNEMTPSLTYRAELEAFCEKVETKAGAFNAARVAIRASVGGAALTRTTYSFAQGIGIVKLVEAEAAETGAPRTLSLIRYVPANAPPDADLVVAVERALAADARFRGRGAPKVVQLRAPELRHAFASRFCRASWAIGSVLMRERSGVAVEMDPLTVEGWNRLLGEDSELLDPPRAACHRLLQVMPKLLQRYERGEPLQEPRPIEMSLNATGGAMRFRLLEGKDAKGTECTVKFKLGAEGIRIEGLEVR